MRNLPTSSVLMPNTVSWSWNTKAAYRSQNDEDKFLIEYFKGRNGGYLIDIAAADGTTCSNSFRLINEYDWNGLLVEPCKKHHQRLQAIYENVKGISLFLGAIHQTNKVVAFNEVEDAEIGLSNIRGQGEARGHSYTTYNVDALDINSVLQKFNVPEQIEFVSLDIENSEEEVINHWNFDKYKVQLWIIEGGARFGGIMSKNGYKSISPAGYRTDDIIYERCSSSS